jgi:hypothetical protein
VIYTDKLKEPKYKSESPQYAKFLLENNKELIFVFDKSFPTLEGYDTLYADVNFNNDLIDDNVIRTDDKGVRIETIVDSNRYVAYGFNTINFNVNNRGYKLKVYKNVIWDGKQVHQGEKYGYAFLLNAAVTLEQEKWEYLIGIDFKPNAHLESVKGIKVFSHSKNLVIKSSVKDKKLNIDMRFVDDNGKEQYTPFAEFVLVKKNGLINEPLLKIANEKRELIVNTTLKHC